MPSCCTLPSCHEPYRRSTALISARIALRVASAVPTRKPSRHLVAVSRCFAADDFPQSRADPDCRARDTERDRVRRDVDGAPAGTTKGPGGAMRGGARRGDPRPACPSQTGGGRALALPRHAGCETAPAARAAALARPSTAIASSCSAAASAATAEARVVDAGRRERSRTAASCASSCSDAASNGKSISNPSG